MAISPAHTAPSVARRLPVSEVVEPQRLAQGDILIWGLQPRLLHPAVAGAALALGITLLRLTAAWQAGHLYNDASPIGFFLDPGMYAHLLIGTVLFGYYAWMPAGICQMFNEVGDRIIGPAPPVGDAESSDRTFSAFAERMQASLHWRYLHLVALAVTVFVTLDFTAFGYAKRAGERHTWSMMEPTSLWLSILWAALTLYVVLVIAARYALAIWWLRRLFATFEIRVRPLHPDGAGGLAPLGRFSIRLSYLVSTVGILLLAMMATRGEAGFKIGESFSLTTDLVLAMVAYVIVSPTLFFALPAVANRTMQGAKDLLLQEVGDRFNERYTLMRSDLKTEPATLKQGLEELDQLQKLYDMTERFPVWPFDVTTLRYFRNSFLLPIVIAVVTKLVLGLIKGA